MHQSVNLERSSVGRIAGGNAQCHRVLTAFGQKYWTLRQFQADPECRYLARLQGDREKTAATAHEVVAMSRAGRVEYQYGRCVRPPPLGDRNITTARNQYEVCIGVSMRRNLFRSSVRHAMGNAHPMDRKGFMGSAEEFTGRSSHHDLGFAPSYGMHTLSHSVARAHALPISPSAALRVPGIHARILPATDWHIATMHAIIGK